MHTILLCGGSGQRLWPLSNPIRSKMFLELLPAPDGGLESMIGRVCRQLSEQDLGKSALFVTHQDQIGLTRRYTKEGFPVIGEPRKRGTFAAAVLGSLYLHSMQKVKLTETICVAPADMLADDNFFGHFHSFSDILKASQADIALLGTRPIHPSDQYGYILPGANASPEYSPVIRFEEKPSKAQAIQLIQQNALWNCGVFAFSLDFMLSYLERIGLPTDFHEFIALYPQLPSISFDKEIVERTSKLAVIRHEGDWQDLGSWESLTKQLSSPITGDGGIWGKTSNTHIINTLITPLYVIGVSNIVAIASRDGILIADKHQANMIKEILEGSSKGPFYGETHWGSYTLLDQRKNENNTVATIKLIFLQDQSTQEICSPHSRKIWTVLAGRGEVILDGIVHPAQVGDVFTISSGVIHEIRADTAMEWIEVRICMGKMDEVIYAG